MFINTNLSLSGKHLLEKLKKCTENFKIKRQILHEKFEHDYKNIKKFLLDWYYLCLYSWMLNVVSAYWSDLCGSIVFVFDCYKYLTYAWNTTFLLKFGRMLDAGRFLSRLYCSPNSHHCKIEWQYLNQLLRWISFELQCNSLLVGSF